MLDGRHKDKEEECLSRAGYALGQIVTSPHCRLTGKAAGETVAVFGIGPIVNRCVQLIGLTCRRPDPKLTINEPLAMIAALYSEPSLRKPFYDRGLHTLMVRAWWASQKLAADQGIDHPSTSLLAHILRYLITDPNKIRYADSKVVVCLQITKMEGDGASQSYLMYSGSSIGFFS